MTEDWQTLLREASQLRKARRVGEAIAAYRRLLAVKPNLPDSWYNLGRLLRQDRQFEAALDAYDRALELQVAEPEEVRLNRAVILADHLARPTEAERELRSALKHNPHYVPALLNLGNLHEDLGDRAAARDSYRRVLELDPGNTLALARLAGLTQSPQLDDALAEKLRNQLARPDLAPAQHADLEFALAGLLDAGGQYAEAFTAAERANRASRTAAGTRYDRSAHEAFVDRLIRTFNKPDPGDDPAPATFICGMFRSGSTLVEQILGAHSGITAAGELDLIPALIRQIPDYPESVATADPEQLGRWRNYYLEGLRDKFGSAALVTDKRPDNFLHIGLIKTIFPGAKIIHTRRDPLDNLLSLYFLHLDPSMPYALDLEDAAHWYGQYERLMTHWKALYQNDIFDVDYDMLVREPKPAIERLLGFLGLKWEDTVLDFHRGRGPVKTASVWQVREALHARSSGRWRNYQSQMAKLNRMLGR